MRSGLGIRSNGWIGIARHDLFRPRCRDQGVSNKPSQIFQVAGNESVSQHQPLHHHHHHPSPCSCAAMLPCRRAPTAVPATAANFAAATVDADPLPFRFM